MKSLIQCLLIITLSILLYSCHDDLQPPKLTLDEQLTQEGLTRTKLGKKLMNPYSLENMQLAMDTLERLLEKTKVQGRNLVKSIDLETTDLYVRFLPKDTTQYNQMLKDSTMIYYDHPLDYEIAQQGDVYIDTTMVGQIGWQYTVVKPDYVFPDTIKYEILERLFIPENHPDYMDKEDGDTTKGRVANRSQLLSQLETLSLYLSDNLPEEEGDLLRKEIYAGNSTRWFWNRPSKWTPKGYINIEDTEWGRIPIRGVKVVARRWFTSKVGYTNNIGFFQTGRFRRPANYKILWERYHFSIREEGFSFFTRQAWVDGPKRKGDWNLYIPKYTRRWFHATVFRAAYHYYYRNIKGLRRPPLNSFWKPQMKISAKNSNGPKNGNYNSNRRILGAFSTIKVWRNDRDSDEIYATTIHELAHAAHWNMGGFDYAFTSDKVKESWARGVEWELTRMRYPQHLGRERRTNDYTLVVADMIDGPATDKNNFGYGRFDHETQDKVTGYSIKQLEDALKGQRTWNTWRDNIKNRYNNPTERFLDELFKAYE